MSQFKTTALILITIGFLSSVVTIATSFYIGNSPPEVLAFIFTLLISGGFFLTGAVWLSEDSSDTAGYAWLPAAILLLLGMSSVLGGIVKFRPLQPGITQGFRAFLAGILILVGIALLIAGWRWVQRQEMRYPLALLTTGLILGSSYLLFESVNNIYPPASYSILGLTIVISLISGSWVFYRLPLQ